MSENNFMIYMLTSPSGKSYIGQTNNFVKRISLHKRKSGCPLVHSAIKKYGIENIKIKILKENISISEANILEKKFILEYGTIAPNGYNLRDGGENSSISETTKQRLSLINKGKEMSEDTRKKISEYQKGRNYEF